MNILSNIPPLKDPDHLLRHFSDTYFALRSGLAILAFAMPLVLYFFGKYWHGLDLQPSMSAYFWAADRDHCATFPMRTIFVGFLFAIGACLYAYKGLTPFENTLLNLSAICAALVAIFPERITVKEAANDQYIAQLFENCPAIKDWAALPSLPIHYIAAITLFVLLAIVAWKCADKSLEYLPADYDAEKFRRAYRIIAAAMILFPVSGLVLAYVFGAGSNKIFFIEAAGVLTFGTYWAVKSYELSLSKLEKDQSKALQYAAQRGSIN